MAFPPSRGLADEFAENFMATIVVRLVGPAIDRLPTHLTPYGADPFRRTR
jgi:hypothetical protein